VTSVSTVLRADGFPFFKKRVAGPEASSQVMLKGVPTLTSAKSLAVFVNIAALATAAKAAAKRVVVNNIVK